MSTAPIINYPITETLPSPSPCLPMRVETPFSFLPKELVIHIFSFISETNRRTIAAVCKSWYNYENSRLASLYAFVTSMPEGSVKTICQSNGCSAKSFLFCESGKVGILEKNQVRILDLKKNENDSLYVGELDLKPLAQAGSLMFLSAGHTKEGFFTKIFCLDTLTGRPLFQLSPKDASTVLVDNEYVHESFSAFVILKKYPLVFLTVSPRGGLIIWESDKGVVQPKQSHILSDKGVRLTLVSEAFLLDSSSLVVKIKDPIDPGPFSYRGAEMIARMHPDTSRVYLFNLLTQAIVSMQTTTPQYLVFPINKHRCESAFKLPISKVSALEIKNNQLVKKCELQYHLVSNKVLVVKNLLIAVNIVDNTISILKAENGELIANIHVSNMGFVHGGRLFGNLLFLYSTYNRVSVDPMLNTISIIDLHTQKNFTVSVPWLGELVDLYLIDSQLFILHSQKVDSYSVYSMPIPDMGKEPIDWQPPAVLPLANDKKTREKITAVFLAISALILLSLSIYFGLSRSLNLSLGLGSCSLLSGMGAGFFGFRGFRPFKCGDRLVGL